MPDATTSPTDQATRIARAVGMTLYAAPTDDGDALIVTTELGAESRKLAETGGTMLFHPGGESGAINEIIVLLDGTGTAEAVLPFAVRISRAEAADIHLVAPAGGEYLTGTPIDTYVRVLVNTMKEQHLQVSGEVVDGNIYEVAAELAARNHGLVASSARDAAGEEAASAFQSVSVLLYTPL